MARHTAAMFVNQGGRVVLQGAFFVLLARSLGARGFGEFAGVVAIVGIVQPFGSLGTMDLLVMHVAIDPRRASRQYATALALTLISGLTLTIAVAGSTPWIAPRGVSLLIVLGIAAGDLLGSRLLDLAAALYQAQSRMSRTAVLQILFYTVRLIGVGGLIATGRQASLAAWAVAYVATSLAVSIPVVIVSGLEVGFASPDLGQYRRDWLLGLQFSVSLTAQTIYNDIDKAMLARLDSAIAAGVYAAAYRVVDIAFTPMKSLLAASYPRLFRHGALGLRPAFEFTRVLAKPGLAYSAISAAVLYFGAGAVPFVLGSSFDPSVRVLRWLAVLPLLKGAHYLAANTLTGAMMQSVRSGWQVAVAGLNVVANLWLIPAYSWHGAVYASFLSDGGLALALWVTIRRRLRVEDRPRSDHRPIGVTRSN